MKIVIAILICIGVFWVGQRLFFSFQKIEKQQSSQEHGEEPAAPPAASHSSGLPGLPDSLEASLDAAEKQGAPGLRAWLNKYRNLVQDPKLADIQLDYVVLLISQDPTEARRVFKDVKDRTPTFSPVYPRLKRLEPNFQ